MLLDFPPRLHVLTYAHIEFAKTKSINPLPTMDLNTPRPPGPLTCELTSAFISIMSCCPVRSICNQVSHTDVHHCPEKRVRLHAVIPAAVLHQLIRFGTFITKSESHQLVSARDDQPRIPKKVLAPRIFRAYGHTQQKEEGCRWKCFVEHIGVKLPRTKVTSSPHPQLTTPLTSDNSPQVQTRSYGRSRCRSYPDAGVYTGRNHDLGSVC